MSMTVFQKELHARLSGSRKRRRWIFVPYDQVTDEIGPLSRESPADLGVIIVENTWKAARRPYHIQKLALVVANMRQFALEQAERGVAVKHVVVHGPYRDAFPEIVREAGPIRVMRPAEYELRLDLAPLFDDGSLLQIPHEGWLTTSDVLLGSHPKGPPYLLERFYRAARQRYGVLMQGKEPIGGKYNFDAENRHPWKGGHPKPPSFPSFRSDPIKQEVGDLLKKHYAHHPGRLNLDALPTTAEDARKLWMWAKENALPHFGRYEDAMSVRSSTLFHTRISALLNIHRLLPVQVVRDAEKLDIPISSKEGFIRQVLGWREFMRHVHEITDGFRSTPSGSIIADIPGDGGYARWAQHPWPHDGTNGGLDGGAAPSFLNAQTPLPPAFWGKPSGLRCLDTVVHDVWQEGWSHHITRLMILSNLATLLDVSPRELTDWFWVAYIDAYDWVVEPNVLGLGTFALGPLFTTKPYISGANYIRRMSDYCNGCRFDPAKNCPFSTLYWAFLDRHSDVLQRNPRLANIYRTLKSPNKPGRTEDQEKFVQIRDALVRGDELAP